VTTFAVVAGVFWCFSGTFNILILGFANLLADGFSMSIGNYLSTKIQREYIQNQRKKRRMEDRQFSRTKEGGDKKYLQGEGVQGELFDEIVRVIASRRKVWIDTMMEEEQA
jgi:vacuolar iron transporter family protein